MNVSTSTRRPWKACAAAAALFALLDVASAAEIRQTSVDVVGQMALRDACPSADVDVADALADAWADVDKPSAVDVTFRLQRHAVSDVAPQSASPHTYHRIRRAVHALSCDGGDDAVHTVRFVVRFVEPGGRDALPGVTAPAR